MVIGPRFALTGALVTETSRPRMIFETDFLAGGGDASEQTPRSSTALSGRRARSYGFTGMYPNFFERGSTTHRAGGFSSQRKFFMVSGAFSPIAGGWLGARFRRGCAEGGGFSYPKGLDYLCVPRIGIYRAQAF